MQGPLASADKSKESRKNEHNAILRNLSWLFFHFFSIVFFLFACMCACDTTRSRLL